jgi:polyisoprenyl-teichoic acid--peptidoglycan teichoic acid transferase
MVTSTGMQSGKILIQADPWAKTQQTDPRYQSPEKINITSRKVNQKRPRKGRFGCLACLTIFTFFFLVLIVLVGGYLFLPFRTNLMVLGIDYSKTNDFIGRSDTLLLITMKPFRPYVGVLSIPRDLWVNIPSIGENRINTANFFAEAQIAGSGPSKVSETISSNFGVEAKYYLRFRFENFIDVIDALGGVDISLPEPMAGYEAGDHHLNGKKALAFARNRIGSDDFYRMERNQLLLKSSLKKFLKPQNWWRIPGVLRSVWNSVDTNIPVWLWPRIGMTFTLVGPEGIDFQKISREMVTPFTTDMGANVLLPDWAQILPLVNEIFGQQK